MKKKYDFKAMSTKTENTSQQSDSQTRRNKMLYLCICGCTCHREDLIYIRANKKNDILPEYKRLACPEHRAYICGREIICSNKSCGKKFSVNTTQGAAPKTCPTCQAANLADYNKSYYRGKKPKVPKRKLTEEEKLWIPKATQYNQFKDLENLGAGWDCKHRDDCLSVYAKYRSMPCPVCEFYKPVQHQHLSKQRDEVLWLTYAPQSVRLSVAYL